MTYGMSRPLALHTPDQRDIIVRGRLWRAEGHCK